MIAFEDVEVINDFGQIRANTYPDNPAFFSMDIDMEGAPLTLAVDPAFIDFVLESATSGYALNDGLLGGVVPAGIMAMEIEVEDLEINPLELLIRDDPSNPVPDVDLNGDGVLATDPTTDVDPSNPDGISVGIVISSVPCHIQR